MIKVWNCRSQVIVYIFYGKKNELKRQEGNNKELTKYDFVICPNCGQSNKNFNIIINDSTDTVENSKVLTYNEFSETDLDEMWQNVLEDTTISNPLKKLYWIFF